MARLSAELPSCRASQLSQCRHESRRVHILPKNCSDTVRGRTAPHERRRERRTDQQWDETGGHMHRLFMPHSPLRLALWRWVTWIAVSFHTAPHRHRQQQQRFSRLRRLNTWTLCRMSKLGVKTKDMFTFRTKFSLRTEVNGHKCKLMDRTETNE
jgi:hypothetical protein